MSLIHCNGIGGHEEMQLSIGACSEPTPKPLEDWHICLYDSEEDTEIFVRLPREFAKEVIETLQRYLERTEENYANHD